MDSCYIEEIDFYIEKPKGWVFFPLPWIKNIREQTKRANENLQEALVRSNDPLIYIQKPLARDDIAFPTVQSSCRYYSAPSEIRQRRLLAQVENNLKSTHLEVDILESRDDLLLSGHPANFINARFLVHNEEGTGFECLSRSWTVFYGGIAYSLGLSGSVTNAEEYLDELIMIENSIIIGGKV